MRVLYVPPVEPYDVIGTVTAEDEHLSEVLDDLRQQAAELGGDAIVLMLARQEDQGFVAVGRIAKTTSGEVQIAADVIRFRRGGLVAPHPSSR